MRSVDEIVTRNVARAISHADQQANKGRRRVDRRVVSARMAEFMDMDPESVDKQLKRYMARGGWTVNYLQGLAMALGTSVEELIQLPDPKAAPSEATRSQLLYLGLGDRLTAPEARTLIRNIHRLLDTRPRFALLLEISEALADAPDKLDAQRSALMLLEKSAAFDAKHRDLRGKPIRDKKSR